MTEKEKQVIASLISSLIIPANGVFQITEYHLTQYIAIYHKLFGSTEKATNSNSNTKFARRLAGRTLLSLNFDRGAKYNEMKAGIVYLIENIAYPLHYKVGLTINLYRRLAQYQTYDPYRSFKIVKYDFVLDRSLKEKEILSYPSIFIEEGEWVLRDNAVSVFDKITSV